MSLGGGGTDLPSYYQKYGGFVISSAIDKYIYLTIHRTFIPELIIKYSRMEKVLELKDVEHPIVREALKLTGVNHGSLEISSMADIPAGTGLGSSGSFTTALLKALYSYKKDLIHPQELAEAACEIEINRLKEPVGKQDQYIAAYGGITCLTFEKDGAVRAEPLKVSQETVYDLEDNLLLFFTGYSRRASSILAEQDSKSIEGDQAMIDSLHHVKELGFRSKIAFEKDDLGQFAEIMREHWKYKKSRSNSISNPKIDEWYELAMNNGALGGKLIGAGGGGFLMFYAEQKSKLRHVLGQAGLTEVRFRFDFEGTKLVTQNA